MCNVAVVGVVVTVVAAAVMSLLLLTVQSTHDFKGIVAFMLGWLQ